MEEKRKESRKRIGIVTIVSKPDDTGGYTIMEFKSIDLSLGGIFISSEDLSVFKLGEELDILVDTSNGKLYEGKARVVRSARIYSKTNQVMESGFGLMFVDPDSAFKENIAVKLEAEEN